MVNEFIEVLVHFDNTGLTSGIGVGGRDGISGRVAPSSNRSSSMSSGTGLPGLLPRVLFGILLKDQD
jgi:hypothetical protein